MTALTVNLTAPRHAPWVFEIGHIAFDWSDAAFEFTVRQYYDAPGDPLIYLDNQTAGTEGISATVALDDDDVPTTTATLRIDQTTLEAIQPFAVTSGSPNREPGFDVKLYYDYAVTPDGGDRDIKLRGSFIIQAGN